jgi:hypothetical protein
MKPGLLLVAAALAAALQGCGTFYAEAEQPRVCLTLPPQAFAIPGGGVVAPPGGFNGASSGSVEVGLADVVPDFLLGGPEKDRVLHFLSFEARIQGAGLTFDWLNNLDLVAGGAPGAAPVQLARYARGGQTGATSIHLESLAPDANLANYLANGGLTLTVSGDVSVPGGQAVPGTWTATISTCFYAKVHKTLQEMIDGT